MAKQFIKKLTNKGEAIRYQMDLGMTNAQISKMLKIPESTVRYYRKRPKTLISKRSSKLPKKYIDEIYRLASSKTTREMPAGLMAIKINEKLQKNNELNKKGKLLSIGKRQINNILKQKFGKPLKIKPIFYLNEDSKKKRLAFCKKIIEMEIDGKKLDGTNIFFTDETKIDTAPNTSNESIRISSKIKNKLKIGDEEGYKMINRERKKFEPSIIVAGGVSFYGLSDLILLKGMMQEFFYAQALEYYRDNQVRIGEVNFRESICKPCNELYDAGYLAKTDYALVGNVLTKWRFSEYLPIEKVSEIVFTLRQFYDVGYFEATYYYDDKVMFFNDAENRKIVRIFPIEDYKKMDKIDKIELGAIYITKDTKCLLDEKEDLFNSIPERTNCKIYELDDETKNKKLKIQEEIEKIRKAYRNKKR